MSRALRLLLLLVSAVAVVALGGCGDDGPAKRDDGSGSRRAAPPPASPAAREPVPPVLRTVESAAEDTIDLALAGERGRVVRTSRRLAAAANGPAAAALRRAGVTSAAIADFRRRAATVARLAPDAALLRVALASNRAFELVPGFFARYRDRVPADVLRLDHLDFEAKLRARAGDRAGLQRAAEGLAARWRALRPAVVNAGGVRPAARFDAHVQRLGRLASGGPPRRAEREAQQGLDLVDELEHVYAG